MGFLSPALLIGLCALAIPVALHLVRRRHAPVVVFGPMELLLRAERRMRRRIRLRDLLLLAVRLGLLLALVLGAARPYLRVPTTAGISPGVPSSVVLVLDDSMSMRDASGGSSAFDRARAAASDVLQSLCSDDNAALILASRPARAIGGGLSFEHAALAESISKVRPTFRSTDLAGALVLARQTLASSVQPVRRIVVLSDMARHGFPADGTVPPTDEAIDLRVVDVGHATPSHRAITRVTSRPAPEVGANVQAIQAAVTNFGDRALSELVVSLEVGGHVVARGFLDVPAGATREKTFFHSFDADPRATVRITPDGLAADDVRHVLSAADRPHRILVVDGDPRPARYDDEVFYLIRALEALGSSPTATDGEGLAAHRFSDHDAVLMANVPEIAPDRLTELRAFVESGGGLFVSAGDRWAATPGGLTRSSVGDDIARLLGVSVEATREEGTFRLARPDRQLPIAEAFPPSGAGLLSARFTRRSRLRLDPGVRAALRFEDGAPALAVSSLGAGRTAFFASTIDRDWCDLPIRPGFVVMVREIVAHLTGRRAGARQERDVHPGEPRVIEARGAIRRLIVRTPGDRSVELGGGAGGVSGVGSFRATEQPGFYRVFVERAHGGLTEDLASSFVVNPDPAESDPKRIELEPGGRGWLAVGSGRRNLPMGPWFLAAVPLLVLGETFLRRR